MRDLSYGWNNGRMMLSALQSLNDESLRLMELISYEDKLPDWTLAKVSTALDRLTMARQHIESLMKMGYKSNPGFMDKVKKALGFAKKTGTKAAKQASRFASDRAIDLRESGAIAKITYDIENIKKCAIALDMPMDQMKQTERYKELMEKLEIAKTQRMATLEARKTRSPIKNPRRRNNGKEGFNAARSMLRKEYAAEYGDDWWKDQSLKDEMYDRLDDMGPWK